MAVTSTARPPATSTDSAPVTNPNVRKGVNGDAQTSSADLTAATPPNIVFQRTKQKKGRKERKQAAQQDSEDVQRPAIVTTSKKNGTTSTADSLLFQRLAHDMTNGLMNARNLKAPTESLDLVNRLSFAALKSTTTTNFTTTTTTTTTELNVVLEKEVGAVPRDRCMRRTPKTHSGDSDSDSENAENGRTAFTHVSNQATKLNHLLPSYQVTSYAARKEDLIMTSRRSPNTFTLGDFAALAALESLAERYGRVSHMGILDPSYTFFINQARTAALYYKGKASLYQPLCWHD